MWVTKPISPMSTYQWLVFFTSKIDNWTEPNHTFEIPSKNLHPHLQPSQPVVKTKYFVQPTGFPTQNHIPFSYICRMMRVWLGSLCTIDYPMLGLFLKLRSIILKHAITHPTDNPKKIYGPITCYRLIRSVPPTILISLVQVLHLEMDSVYQGN